MRIHITNTYDDELKLTQSRVSVEAATNNTILDLHETADTPKDAIKKVLQAYKKYYDELDGELTLVRKVIRDLQVKLSEGFAGAYGISAEGTHETLKVTTSHEIK